MSQNLIQLPDGRYVEAGSDEGQEYLRGQGSQVPQSKKPDLSELAADYYLTEKGSELLTPAATGVGTSGGIASGGEIASSAGVGSSVPSAFSMPAAPLTSGAEGSISSVGAEGGAQAGGMTAGGAAGAAGIAAIIAMNFMRTKQATDKKGYLRDDEINKIWDPIGSKTHPAAHSLGKKIGLPDIITSGKMDFGARLQPKIQRAIFGAHKSKMEERRLKEAGAPEDVIKNPGILPHSGHMSEEERVAAAKETGMSNEDFERTRDEKYLRPQDITRSGAFYEHFKDWDKYSDKTKEAIAKAAVDHQALREHHGTLEVDFNKEGVAADIGKVPIELESIKPDESPNAHTSFGGHQQEDPRERRRRKKEQVDALLPSKPVPTAPRYDIDLSSIYKNPYL